MVELDVTGLYTAIHERDTRIAALEAERDAAQALSAMSARKFTQQLERAEDLAGRLAAAEAALRVELDAAIIDIESLCTGMPDERVRSYVDGSVKVGRLRAALAGSREQATGEGEGE